MERCICKPKSTQDSCSPSGLKRLEVPPLEPAEGAQPCGHFDFTLVASRNAREYISVVFSLPVCGHLCQQPQETAISSYTSTGKKLSMI